MAGILIALENREESLRLQQKLTHMGYTDVTVLPGGAAVLSMADARGEGIVICNRRLRDMMYSQLREYLPGTFSMLLVADPWEEKEQGSDIMQLYKGATLPQLKNTIALMMGNFSMDRKRKKGSGKGRKQQDDILIREAKALLMSRNNMSEREAHRYLQKCSMDYSRSFAQSAAMILEESMI